MILLAVGREEERTGDCGTVAGTREELKSNRTVDDTNKGKDSQSKRGVDHVVLSVLAASDPLLAF
jgi:hypothetical protein